MKSFPTLALLFSISSTVNASEDRIEEILNEMTLEQKVAQMVQAEIQFITPEEVKQYGIGSVLNGGGSYPNKDKYAATSDWLDLADAYYEASLDARGDATGIPIIWGTDAVHGHNNVYGATLFPHNIGLGAAHNPSLVADIAKATALEVRATGIDWIFAPTVAIAKDDRWGRTYESFSDQSALVEEYTPKIIKAIQDVGLAATAKHFIGDGGTQQGIDQGDVNLSLDSLLRDHGAGYLAAIDNGVYSVMASFNSWKGEKVHGNHEILTETLKERLGFDGVLVSDWNGIGQVKGCTNSSCPQAINAGLDMVMVPELWYEFLQNTVSQVESGVILESRIDDAVTRILRMKFKLGLFDRIKPSERARTVVPDLTETRNKNRILAREAVRQSLVLLRNSEGVLPIDPRQHILVIGDADDIGKAAGGWTLSWQGTENTKTDFPRGTSIYDALRNQIEKADGTIELSHAGQFKKKPDRAIVIFGEQPYAEGFGDVSNLMAPELEETNRILLKLKEQGIPTVTVFLTGRPMWINPVLSNSDAFVVAWLPGSEGGGVADLLLRDASGKVQFDFQGRLSFAWPNDVLNDQDSRLPLVENLFPYGYGLSLASASSAELSRLKLEPTAQSVQRNPSSITIFESRSQADWEAFLGEPLNWQQQYNGGEHVSDGGQLKVRRSSIITQEDSLRLVFRGDGRFLSQWYWQSKQARDFTDLLGQESLLKLTVAVNSYPSTDVSLRMDCGYPCSAALPLEHVLKKLPLGVLTELAIPLRCFSDQGLNIARIDTPALIATTGTLDLSISSVKIGKSDAESEVVPCT